MRSSSHPSLSVDVGVVAIMAVTLISPVDETMNLAHRRNIKIVLVRMRMSIGTFIYLRGASQASHQLPLSGAQGEEECYGEAKSQEID